MWGEYKEVTPVSEIRYKILGTHLKDQADIERASISK